MIDATAIPILIKAVDFLFDECRKILEERRNRRQIVGQQDSSDNKAKAEHNDNEPAAEKIISDRADALGTPIEESAWKEMENEIKHLIELLEIQKKSYQLHVKQYEIYGEADVPQRLIHSLDKDEKGIIETSGKLQEALSKVYKTKVSVLDETEFDY